MRNSDRVPIYRHSVHYEKDISLNSREIAECTLYSTTPGGTRIYYDRMFLLSRRVSPIAQSPPSNLAYIAEVTLITEPFKPNSIVENDNNKNYASKGMININISLSERKRSTSEKKDHDQFSMDIVSKKMTTGKEEKTNVLNNVNNQLKDLIELIEKEKDSSFSMKSFDKLDKKKKKSKKKWFIICFLIATFICMYFILSNEILNYDIYFILPFWDWTNIYTRTCFIANPFYNNSLDLSECNKCVNTTEVVTQSNISFFNFTKTIYLNHLPVIIDDATENWPAIKELTIKNLFQLFIDDPVLSENDLCYFESNRRNYNQPGGADQLFNDYINGDLRAFIVHWNNCKRETLKIVRSYYSKPYFLPPSLGQTLMGNWFLISSGFHKGANHLHKVPLNHNWVWLAQIQGSSSIELRPKHPCDRTCSILKSVTLNKGDLIIYSHLYDALYSPLKKETVLLAQGVD
ncbi:unnamed protein product [Rotaria magnacalcarata]|uniref:Uncharacterized protein n=1 Tax=Rotaria magnacalcarata TaxID=392030 RepID=A0A816Z3J8_9BILA|nr:unnamed protein product [Rotaria magnacalcarata]